MELTKASRQWATRPADERFVNLIDLRDACERYRQQSRATVVSSRRLQVKPAGDGGLAVHGPNGHGFEPTNWAFSQLASRVGAPGSYLRTLPPEMAADCLNYGLLTREVEDLGVLLHRNGSSDLAAVTGPAYGRIWDADIASMLVDRFGDGVSGHWRQPGEFGERVEITKANCTLYASDRDMFVFLADEDRRIEVPGRRAGMMGTFARGFFVWNSQVGKTTFGAAFFLFDYACCNRIVWGAREYQEVKIRHTASAPDKWLDQVVPVLSSYSEASAAPIKEAIEAAQAQKVKDDLDAFLRNRFGAGMVARIKAAHEADEGRPIETRWDVVVGATAAARGIEHQDHRVKVERLAGELLTA